MAAKRIEKKPTEAKKNITEKKPAETKKNTTEKKSQAKSSASKTSVKENDDSVIVKVDNETQMLLQTIKNSVSSEILDGIRKIEAGMGKDGDNDAVMSEIQKITKRIDSLDENLDDLNTSINLINQKLDALISRTK